MIERLRIGLLGAGEWGPNLLRAFRDRPDCEVLWVCDRNPSRLDWVGPRFPEVERILDSRAALLTRFELCRQALEAGKHVFVEKPLACSYTEAKILVELAARARRKLMVGHVFLFHPAMRAIQRLLDQGVLGRPLFFSSERTNFGPVREDVSVLWDLAPHDLAVLRYLVPELPSEARATGHSILPGAPSDVVDLELRWASGLVAQSRLSWINPRKVRRTLLLGSRRGVRFEEEEGKFSVRLFTPGAPIEAGSSQGLMGYREPLRGEGEPVAVPEETAVGLECGAFVDWVQREVPQCSSGDLGAEVVYLLERLEQSLSLGGETVLLARDGKPA
jgi:predicted dehydrogenase